MVKVLGGSGRLTDPVIDRMQTAYGYAIRKNKGDPEASCKVIWAKLSISEIRYSLFRQVPVFRSLRNIYLSDVN